MAEQNVAIYANLLIEASSSTYTPCLIKLDANGLTTAGNTAGDVTDFLPSTAGGYFGTYAMYRVNQIHMDFIPSKY
jgi:hypothetical protein